MPREPRSISFGVAMMPAHRGIGHDGLNPRTALGSAALTSTLPSNDLVPPRVSRSPQGDRDSPQAACRDARVCYS